MPIKAFNHLLNNLALPKPKKPTLKSLAQCHYNVRNKKPNWKWLISNLENMITTKANNRLISVNHNHHPLFQLLNNEVLKENNCEFTLISGGTGSGKTATLRDEILLKLPNCPNAIGYFTTSEPADNFTQLLKYSTYPMRDKNFIFVDGLDFDNAPNLPNLFDIKIDGLGIMPSIDEMRKLILVLNSLPGLSEIDSVKFFQILNSLYLQNHSKTFASVLEDDGNMIAKKLKSLIDSLNLGDSYIFTEQDKLLDIRNNIINFADQAHRDRLMIYEIIRYSHSLLMPTLIDLVNFITKENIIDLDNQSALKNFISHLSFLSKHTDPNIYQKKILQIYMPIRSNEYCINKIHRSALEKIYLLILHNFTVLHDVENGFNNHLMNDHNLIAIDGLDLTDTDSLDTFFKIFYYYTDENERSFTDKNDVFLTIESLNSLSCKFPKTDNLLALNKIVLGRFANPASEYRILKKWAKQKGFDVNLFNLETCCSLEIGKFLTFLTNGQSNYIVKSNYIYNVIS